MSRLLVAAVMAFAATSVVVADEIILTSGGKLTGIAREEGGNVVVETGYGTVTLSKDMVVSIDKTKKSKLQEFKELVATAKGLATAQQLYDLARWAKENGLPKYHRDYLQKTIEQDPDHEFARRELGYQLYNGKWMTSQEVMLAKGFILFEGKWVTPSEKELIVAERIKEKQRRDEEKRNREEERRRRYEEALAKYKEALQKKYTAAPTGYSWYPYYGVREFPLVGTFDVTKINPYSMNPLGLPWLDPFKK